MTIHGCASTPATHSVELSPSLASGALTLPEEAAIGLYCAAAHSTSNAGVLPICSVYAPLAKRLGDSRGSPKAMRE